MTKYTEELSKIAAAHGGTLYPRDVVEAARPEDSPLHDAFTWDDTEAARQWRLEQARRLIRVQVTILPNNNKPVQAFVSLTQKRLDDGGYLPIQTILSNEKLIARMKQDAATELEIFTRKFQQISELKPVFEAAELFIQQQKETTEK